MKHFIFVLVLLVSLASNAQFGPGQLIYEHPISGGRMIRTADFDQDGDQDAVIAIFDFIAWYPNDGNGNFGEPITIELDLGGVFVLHPVDLDGDDRIDLVVSYFEQDEIVWYRNLGGGVFAAGEFVVGNLENVSGVVSEDIDLDGDQDLVLGVTNGLGLYWIENLDGLGNFGTEISIDVNLVQAREQAVGDIDGDGDIDVLSNAGSGGVVTLAWYENTDGQGDFSNQHIVDTGGLYEVAIALDDLDGDDDLDIISLKTDDVTWRENLDGLGTFGPINVISDLVDNGSDIHVADIDNDGDLDVLSTSIGFDMPEDHKVAWYEHLDGNGAFGPQQLIDTFLLFPRSVTTADLDDDGDLDVLASAVHPNDERSVWYENETIFGLEDMVVPSVLVSPNPVTDILQFDVTGGVISEVTGYDVSGRLLLRAAGPLSQVDVSGLPNGMLFVHIVTENGSQVVKVVKESSNK